MKLYTRTTRKNSVCVCVCVCTCVGMRAHVCSVCAYVGMRARVCSMGVGARVCVVCVHVHTHVLRGVVPYFNGLCARVMGCVRVCYGVCVTDVRTCNLHVCYVYVVMYC